VRRICSEVRATPRPGDYNLSDYVRDKVIESTSATLLKLVSSLVSGGAITKTSLTLAQCIQQHICNAGRNQTTHGFRLLKDSILIFLKLESKLVKASVNPIKALETICPDQYQIACS